ncbi:MAG: S41 family peptidase [candidate division Zixibacteria bacterium]|nr:S41 family peptidase [candidate division Zixibacteria bacterium]MBU1471650.1 S41 family peptidase [candidate division Zixibacteria bacterium]MBU2626296.1 S41 family peptidase [candidate division Zixibacteria bacterium]
MSENLKAISIRLSIQLVVVALTAGMLFSQAAFAQGGPGHEESRAADAKLRAEIIDSVTLVLDSHYVFPDVAKEMKKYVRKRLKDGKYDTLNTVAALARALTDDLREVCHDRHLGIAFMPDEYFEGLEADTVTDERREQELKEAQYDNFGFYKVERLPGNIGYIDFRRFADAQYAGATAIAAMNFLAYSDAIIFDLRNNGGGSPSMIQLISSYFFEEPEHLNSFYLRYEDTIHQFWTQAYVPGRRMANTDLYVLTSSYTFSGAEEFTYNMKSMERATIIGETTGGGAHPVDEAIFPNLNVAMRVPMGRAINPITGTNWEGTGITPDIEVPSDQALSVARREAMTKLLEKTTDEDRRNDLEWNIATLEAELNPVTVDESILKSYVGTYGPRTLIFENGDLYYQRQDRPKYKMIPMANDLFMFKEIDYFRIKVIRDDSGNPTELNGLYDNGHVDISPKSGS